MARRDNPAAAPSATTRKGDGAAGKPKKGEAIRSAYRVAREQDPKLPYVLLGTGLAVVAVFVLLGILIGHPVVLTITGVFIALAVMLFMFGKRAEKAVYGQIEGQPGAAAGVLQGMRGRWTVTPMVAYNRNQDVVHRVLGRCGLVLIGEGQPGRLAGLLTQERKKLQRLAPDVPIAEYVIGDGDGQIPLRKLQSTVMKLPRKVAAAQVTEVDRRLKAMGPPGQPLPKGPMPRGMRMPKGM